jgi:hypothetical protein
MDAVSLEHQTATVEGVDPLLADVLAWAALKPDDRDDPEWLYAYADVLRVCEAVQGGRSDA